MIPKIIHYCWFGGGGKSAKMEKCIASWRKYCPDYEFREWNETNFNIDRNPYTRWSYDNGKFAFLSDYVRLIVLEEYGGIYMDTDVELVKKPDELLNNEAFFGFENKSWVATGLGCGAVPHHPAVRAMLAEYEPLLDGQHGTIGCPRLNTAALLKLGLKQNGELQNLSGAVIYPPDYFNPYDDATGRLKLTTNTVSIHWYAKSWMDRNTVLRSILTKPLHRLFGTDVLQRFR